MNNIICRIFAGVLALFACAAMAESLPDPTRPLWYAQSQASAPKLVLQAILKREAGREAVVNGQRVKVGSLVKGARVKTIGENSLVYSYGGRRQTLTLRPTIRKQN